VSPSETPGSEPVLHVRLFRRFVSGNLVKAYLYLCISTLRTKNVFLSGSCIRLSLLIRPLLRCHYHIAVFDHYLDQADKYQNLRPLLIFNLPLHQIMMHGYGLE
jgi:hypothetical protein